MLNMCSISISGTSRIDGKEVAYFSANFANNTYNISKNVTDMVSYNANQSECEADYAAFESKAKQYAALIAGGDAAGADCGG